MGRTFESSRVRHSFLPIFIFEMKKEAFSLIELSIVILIIGILIAGVTQSSRLIQEMRFSTARTLTKSSDVSGIKDLALWLETTSDKSFTVDSPENGFALAQWNDINPQSSFRTNALQATSTKQPIYSEGIINNLPAIKFDGTDDNMSVADDFDSDTQNATLFLVWKPSSVAANAAILEKWSGSGSFPYCLRFNATPRYLAISSDGTTTVTVSATTTPPAVGVAKVISARVSYGDTTTIWINGSQEGSSSNATVTSDTKNSSALYIGSRGNDTIFANGYAGEVIIFSRALKSEERIAVERYLGKKWGIKVL